MIAIDIHEDTRIIRDMLMACSIGDTITLSAMSSAIRKDISRVRGVFYSASRITARESGAVFKVVRGVGYERIRPDELHKVGQRARVAIRRKARAGSRTITYGLAGANSIDPKAMARIMTEQASLGVLEHLARDRNLPKIDESSLKAPSVTDAAKELLLHISGEPARRAATDAAVRPSPEHHHELRAA